MKNRHLALVLTLFIGFIAKAQKTYIPDDTFEEHLIFAGYDSGPLDDSVYTANIDTITSLLFQFISLEDLTGIEDFAALEHLNFWGTDVTHLDLSNNLSLITVQAFDNPLVSVNLANNTSVKFVALGNNELTNLDVSNCTALETLSCGANKLTELDVSTSPLLRSLGCNDNKLTHLNVAHGNNEIITFFRAEDNPNLTCIQVDDVNYVNTNWNSNNGTFNYDAGVGFSEDCSVPISIKETTYSNAVEIYPNPVTNMIHLELEDQASYKLYTISGETVLHSGYLNAGKSTLDVSGLECGVYIFTALMENGKIVTKKVVKQ